jgi:hypothetical protein
MSSGGLTKMVPGRNSETITPSDTVNLSTPSRAIWVGGAGNIAVEMLDGGTQVFVGVVAGSLLPLQVTRVNSTDTTATNMVSVF